MVALQSNVSQFQTKAGKAIEDFLVEYSKGSEDTTASYRGDINKFLEAIFNKKINTILDEELELLDYDSFKAFLDSLYGTLANGTINRNSSCIRSLYKHLKARKIINIDISFFELIKSLPNKMESYDVMPMEVVEQYLSAIEKFEKHKQSEKKWAVMMAIELGLRASEIIDLKWSQFKPDGNIVYVNGYGKGNVEYIEVIDRELYNEMISEIRIENQKNLFTLSKKNITDMMTRLRKLLKHEDRNYVFHSFKKTSVNNTFRLTGNIRDAQAKGKHSKIETTQIYLQEIETKMTGYFSLEKNLNHDLYKEVNYKTLIETLKTMPKELLFILNLKLKDNI
ncbi:site-specific integrase [Bacillus sp. FJAT-22090]|uniref:tyrosine-type recombinase/integrase n=1 Tax=Bacillus sp. FJAT-22090 TaxID=1581038 RepID=UPI0011A7CC1D|nr:site-specific integrase [Bacillus sp. FJAT-22090]